MAKRKQNLSIDQILEEIAKAPTPQAKAEVCWLYESKGLKNIFAYAFNPNLKLEIKEVPKYTPDPRPAPLALSTLQYEASRLDLFREGAPMKQKDRKIVYLLSGLSKDESWIMEAVIRKDLNVDGVDAKFLNQVWPELNIPEE
jgi:hypothetical protein